MASKGLCPGERKTSLAIKRSRRCLVVPHPLPTLTPWSARSCIRSLPPRLSRTLDTLIQYLTQLRIIAVFVHVVNADVSAHAIISTMNAPLDNWVARRNIPLQVVRPWILVFALWTEGTHVAWTVVYEAVPDHLVLALETFPSLTTGALGHRAVVWADRAVNISVRASKDISRCRRRSKTSAKRYLSRY